MQILQFQICSVQLLVAMIQRAIHGGYIHQPSYYKNYKWRAVECFANLFDLYCVNDERWKFLQDNFTGEVTDCEG